jgi:hypothetical protein
MAKPGAETVEGRLKKGLGGAHVQATVVCRLWQIREGSGRPQAGGSPPDPGPGRERVPGGAARSAQGSGPLDPGHG